MLNQQEQFYLQSYLLNQYLNDYKDYYCETKYNNYSTNIYDVICYLSKSNLTLNNNILRGNNVRECKLDFDVYSDNVNSISCENLNSVSFSVNNNEISYSTFTNDIIIDYKKTYEYFNNFNLIITSILLILTISFLYKFFRNIIRG